MQLQAAVYLSPSFLYCLSTHAWNSSLPRTEANVVDSDATVIFAEKRTTGGSLGTIEFARKHVKLR